MVDHAEVKAGEKNGFWSGSLFFFQLLCTIWKSGSTHISQHIILKFQECFWFETIYLHYKQVVHCLCLWNWIPSIRLLVWFFLSTLGSCFVFLFSNPIAMTSMFFIVLSYQDNCVLMCNRVGAAPLQQSTDFPKWNRHGCNDLWCRISQDY